MSTFNRRLHSTSSTSTTSSPPVAEGAAAVAPRAYNRVHRRHNHNARAAAATERRLKGDLQRLRFDALFELATPVPGRPLAHPDWAFSCFAPAAELPNLLTGCELSPEEHRWAVYQVRAGLASEAEVATLLSYMAARLEQQEDAVHAHPDEALRRYKQFYRQHPLALDYDMLANGPLSDSVRDPMLHVGLLCAQFVPPAQQRTSLLLAPAAVALAAPVPPAVLPNQPHIGRPDLPQLPGGFVAAAPVFAAPVQPPQPPQPFQSVPTPNDTAGLSEMEIDAFRAAEFAYLEIPESEPPPAFR